MTEQPYDIFFSYSSKDVHLEETRLRLRDHLTDAGYRVYLAELEIFGGDNDVWSISSALSGCQYFLLFLTPTALESPWVQKEVSAALLREFAGEITIIPLVYEDCQPPALLAPNHYVDFTRSWAAGLDFLERSLRHADRERQEAAHAGRPMPIDLGTGPLIRELGVQLRHAVEGSDEVYLVMDLGGTKAYVSVMDGRAVRLHDRKYPTEGHFNPGRMFDFITTCLETSIQGAAKVCGLDSEGMRSRLSAIAVAFPGPTDPTSGWVLDSPNLGMRNFPLAGELTRVFGLPAYLGNDVNLGTMGEQRAGVARGRSNVVGIMVGTGIGGGIVLDGRLHDGPGHTAGELGHMVVDAGSKKRCGCGQYGCLEALASRKAMAEELSRRKRHQGNRDPRWDPERLGSSAIAADYLRGDPDAVAVVDEAAVMCGKAVFSLVNMLNPEAVVFSGGLVLQLGERFLGPARAEVARCMRSVGQVDGRPVEVMLGDLPNPNLTGACLMTIEQQRQGL